MSTDLAYPEDCTCDHCQHWRPIVEQLAEKLNDYQQWEERRRKYDRKSNQELSAKARQFAVHLDRLAEQWKSEGRTGPQQINVKSMSLELGFGEAAGYSALNELDRAGHLKKTEGDPFTIRTERGKLVTITPTRVEVLGRDPDELDAHRNHGGTHCSKCGSDAGTVEQDIDETTIMRHRVIKTEVRCRCCNELLRVVPKKVFKPEMLKPPKRRVLSGPDLQIEGRVDTPETETAGPPANPQLDGINHTGGEDIRGCESELSGEDAEPCGPAPFLLELLGQGFTLDRETGELKPNHIVMSDSPQGGKYYTVDGHPTLEDCEAHLHGDKTLGGYLTHGQHCRAVLFDGDGAKKGHTLAMLEGAAEKLLRSGARPLLETTRLPDDADHAGGGKLWLVFSSRVSPADAIATACRIAPELRELEHFPPGRVRVPGGLYRRGVNCWSELQAYGAEDDGWYTTEVAIQTMMENLTPAAWVTERGSDEPARKAQAAIDPPALDEDPVPPDYPRPRPAAASDPEWLARFPALGSSASFWHTAKEVAAHFNARHAVADLLPIESNGKGRAHWRDERTPSVHLYPDNTWHDFGGAGEGGDALELSCRIEGITRSEALRAAAVAMRTEAERELGRAAREGRGPAGWVAAITSPAGWVRYDQMRAEASP